MLRTQRFSASSGLSSRSQTLISHSSPRHSHRAHRNGHVVLVLEVALCAVFLLALVAGVRYSAAPPRASAVPELEVELDAAGYVHTRSPKASSHHNSDLSIKLARGRKDMYGDAGNSGGGRAVDIGRDGPVTLTTAADQQQQQQQQQQLDQQQQQLQQQPDQQPGSSGSNGGSSGAGQAQLLQQQQPEQQQTVVAATSSQATKQEQPAAAAQANPQQAAAASNAGASQAAAATPTPSGAATGGADPLQSGAAAGGADPLHDQHFSAQKEGQQLAALSQMVQQQQDTIKRQASALLDLQKRFVQQERQLQAATASAAASNTSEGTQVEPYFPEEKVAQEVNILKHVEAQIEEVAAGVAAASAALPALGREAQAKQVAELARADQLMSRLSRVAAAISLRAADPLTEGGHDPVAELRHYYGTVANDVTLSWTEALARQSRPTAASLGLDAEPYSDAESDLETLHIRLAYALEVMQATAASAPCSLALVTTWAGDLWGLRRELVPWLTFHAQLGVSRLYVLYEGGDANTLSELSGLAPYINVMLASAPLANASQAAEFNAWVAAVPDTHIREWRSQPGNYQLMTKQGFAVTKALELARAANVSWLIHIDPDELLHPGAAHTAGSLAGAFSMLPELCRTPAHVPSVRFVNVEGVPEAADLHNRYEQVTLFRSHRHLVPPAVQPFRYIFKQGHAAAWLHLYTNGKSAVRPDAPGVTQGGPHVFVGPADARWATPDNPHGLWHPVISNSTLVLHYAYTTPGDVAVKAGRSCPKDVVEAALAGNTSQVSRCFVLDIDQRAFLAAIQDRRAAGLAPVESPAAQPTGGAADAASSGAGSQRELLVDSEVFNGDLTSSGFSNKSWPAGRAVQEFFWGELALSEGAPFECLTPDGMTTGWCSMRRVGHLKSLLISSGLMLRLHAPSQVMRGIEETVEQLIKQYNKTEGLRIELDEAKQSLQKLQMQQQQAAGSGGSGVVAVPELADASGSGSDAAQQQPGGAGDAVPAAVAGAAAGDTTAAAGAADGSTAGVAANGTAGSDNGTAGIDYATAHGGDNAAFEAASGATKQEQPAAAAAMAANVQADAAADATTRDAAAATTATLPQPPPKPPSTDPHAKHHEHSALRDKLLLT